MSMGGPKAHGNSDRRSSLTAIPPARGRVYVTRHPTGRSSAAVHAGGGKRLPRGIAGELLVNAVQFVTRCGLIPPRRIPPAKERIHASQARRPRTSPRSCFSGIAAIENSRPAGVYRGGRNAESCSDLVPLGWTGVCDGYSTESAQVEGAGEESEGGVDD